MREKVNALTNKFICVRKERDQLKKENKDLQNEILILQSNIRQMIPGFSSNTSCSFPMLNELQNKLTEFFKCECQDVFFDLLCPELNMEGLVFFFKECFSKVQEIINLYYEPVETLLKRTLCVDDMWSSIDNVLRKSYQSNHKKIFNQVFNDIIYNNIMLYIQSNLKLMDEEPQANLMIVEFLKKTALIYFFSHISDPVVKIDIKTIGQTVHFNSTKHDSIDGFVKPKHECVVLLPGCYKMNFNSENLIVKSQVLPIDYEFP